MIKKTKNFIEVCEYNEFLPGERVVFYKEKSGNYKLPKREYVVEAFYEPMNAHLPAYVYLEGVSSGIDSRHLLPAGSETKEQAIVEDKEIVCVI